MTRHVNPAATSPAPACLRDHIARNLDPISDLLETVGGAAAIDVLADLWGELDRIDPDPARVRDGLAQLHAFLVQAPVDTSEITTTRQDLDAAIRWHGARIGDLVAQV